MARESAEHIYSFFPGLEDKLSIDDYLKERQEMQEEMFRKVPPMKGAAELVKRLVCVSFTGSAAVLMRNSMPRTCR